MTKCRAICAITDTYDYDAFGNKINSTGSTPNNFMYRGEQFDSDLGMYYLRARYYSPTTGRFMSRDPEDGKLVDPASLHKYLYADGDPVNGIDPSGRAAYIESIFTKTYVAAPVEIYAEVVGKSAAVAFCFYADFVARATLGVPIGMSGFIGPPGWPGPARVLCKVLGF